MNSTRISNKPSFQGATGVEKRERSFELSLPTLVSGLDAYGDEYREHTEVTCLSSETAVFRLNSGVTIGSRVNLSLEVPKTYFLENNLKLELSGRVTFVKEDNNGDKKQLISLQLDKNYKLHSTPREKT